MEKELNIADILKEKPQNTRLWSPIFGDCEYLGISDYIDPIQIKTKKVVLAVLELMANIIKKNNIEIGFSNGWHYTADYRDFDDEALGIPLTPEILEKNGWTKQNMIVNEYGDEQSFFTRDDMVDIYMVKD